MSSETYHEPVEELSDHARDMHRAILSLMEELEAVDWYQQRADVTKDEALRAVLLHNRDEEVEHAMMTLEWIRRKDEVFARNAETYLFTTVPITEVEEVEGPEGGAREKSGKAPPGSSARSGGAKASGRGDGGLGVGVDERRVGGSSSGKASDGSLGIGSLKD